MTPRREVYKIGVASAFIWRFARRRAVWAKEFAMKKRECSKVLGKSASSYIMRRISIGSDRKGEDIMIALRAKDKV